MTVELWVPGRPERWERPLNRARGGRRTNPAMALAKENIAWQARIAFRGQPQTGAMQVHSEYVFKAPRQKTNGLTGGYAPLVPDTDNLSKLVWDAFNKLIYVDDGQVCRAFMEKRYAREGEKEGTHVRVGGIDEPVILCASCQERM